MLSFTAWKGVGTPRWVGTPELRAAPDRRSVLGLDAQHAVVHDLDDRHPRGDRSRPRLAAVRLCARPVRRDGCRASSAPAFYLPQILPLTVAGVLWGWILSPVGVANAILKIDRAGAARAELDRRRDLCPARPCRSSSSGSRSAIASWSSWRACRASTRRSTKRRSSTAPAGGSGWCRSPCPMLAPEIFVVVLTTLIHALKVFAPIFVLTQGGPDDATLAPSYLTYYHFFTTQRVGYAAAVVDGADDPHAGARRDLPLVPDASSGTGSIEMADAAVLAGSSCQAAPVHARRQRAPMRWFVLALLLRAARLHAVPVRPRAAQCVQAGRRLRTGRAAVDPDLAAVRTRSSSSGRRRTTPASCSTAR